MAPRVKQKLATNAPRRVFATHLYTDPWTQTTHTSARTLVTQCRKTFTGNALEDIFISIYFI